jgi:hypothetical protein
VPKYQRKAIEDHNLQNVGSELTNMTDKLGMNLRSNIKIAKKDHKVG